MKKNCARVAVFNPELGFGVSIEFDTAMLNHFVEWKMMVENDYLLGLEPANTTIDGIADAIANGSMKYIEPDKDHRISSDNLYIGWKKRIRSNKILN